MPWKPSQQRAIAAKLARQGKSREEISAFFRRHGHDGSGSARALKHASERKRKR